MTRRVYVQCIDGEYFRGSRCPNDGWESTLWDRVRSLDGASLDDIVAGAGLTSEELTHLLVVEQHPSAPLHDVLFVAERN